MKQFWTLVALLILPLVGMQAQADPEAVLFTVEGKPVTVEEFVYIYSKTNGEHADFSERSLREYLDLYIRFKLKVERAREMQLDTIKSLQDELAGYRRQLADSYLIDRSIGDQLVEEAYQHIQEDVDFSHILIALGEDAEPADTLAAFQKAQAALRRIQQGAEFGAIAQEISDDRYTKEKGGRVGYVTALLPNGLHQLERTIYSAPIGQVVGPIRTKAGYHLVKVHDRRPARGEMEVAHIMVRKEGKSPEAAKARIDSIYALLQAGKAFEDIARTTSEDGRTAGNGGYIGFFGVNRFEKAFEDAAFSLTQDDTYTAPIETSIGWHIIKRISRKGIQPLAVEKPRLESRIRQDARFAEAQDQLLDDIRRRSNMQENTTLLNEFVTTLPDSFLTFRWKAPETSGASLFSLGDDYEVSLSDFATYLERSTRDRVTLARNHTAESAARELYKQYLDDQLMKYEETQLEARYPEFRSLMREYQEGILLFEATKMEVWDKASQDSVGLAEFFTEIQGKYRWLPRARASVFRIGMNHAEEAPEIRTYAIGHSAEAVLERFNTSDDIMVSVEEGLYEKGRQPELVGVPWEVGAVSDLIPNSRSRSIKFYKIEELLPEADKTLNEARGYVIADYQDRLENMWVNTLIAK
ncbi:MAG: peptidylprolyl isomerase, partial [Lewinella sp.]|nr:peptidylprolyl isomerase [Lewinella sp.]